MPVLIKVITREKELIYLNASDIYRIEEWKSGDEYGARIIRSCGCWLDLAHTPEEVADLIDEKIMDLGGK